MACVAWCSSELVDPWTASDTDDDWAVGARVYDYGDDAEQMLLLLPSRPAVDGGALSVATVSRKHSTGTALQGPRGRLIKAHQLTGNQLPGGAVSQHDGASRGMVLLGGRRRSNPAGGGAVARRRSREAGAAGSGSAGANATAAHRDASGLAVTTMSPVRTTPRQRPKSQGSSRRR